MWLNLLVGLAGNRWWVEMVQKCAH